MVEVEIWRVQYVKATNGCLMYEFTTFTLDKQRNQLIAADTVLYNQVDGDEKHNVF